MKRPKGELRPLPKYDYGLALQNAVSWLGDRYLLAEPVTRRNEEQAVFRRAAPLARHAAAHQLERPKALTSMSVPAGTSPIAEGLRRAPGSILLLQRERRR